MLLSSHSEDSVKRLGEEYLQYIQDHPDKLADLAYTLSQRRERFPYRGFIPAGPGIMPSVSAIVKCPAQNVARVMIFSGQGAQWPEMGRRLLESCPWVKVDIAQMDKILQELKNPPSWSLAGKHPDHYSVRVYCAQIPY
jgi:acyl transferase domain-containing protein